MRCTATFLPWLKAAEMSGRHSADCHRRPYSDWLAWRRRTRTSLATTAAAAALTLEKVLDAMHSHLESTQPMQNLRQLPMDDRHLPIQVGRRRGRRHLSARRSRGVHNGAGRRRRRLRLHGAAARSWLRAGLGSRGQVLAQSRLRFHSGKPRRRFRDKRGLEARRLRFAGPPAPRPTNPPRCLGAAWREEQV